jgi:hypothetical protein
MAGIEETEPSVLRSISTIFVFGEKPLKTAGGCSKIFHCGAEHESCKVRVDFYAFPYSRYLHFYS